MDGSKSPSRIAFSSVNQPAGMPARTPIMSTASAPSSSSPTSLRNAVIRLALRYRLLVVVASLGLLFSGGFLARLAGRTAQEVMTYMTIPSTISGGPSIFQVHLGSGEVLHEGDEADVLVAFYKHSYENHIAALRDGGICFYDTADMGPEDVKNERGIIHIGVPFTSATVEAVGGSTRDRGKNMFVLGMLLGGVVRGGFRRLRGKDKAAAEKK